MIHASPWGEVQHRQSYGQGITFVDTAGHGGFHVDMVTRMTMPIAILAFPPFAGSGWYEEDCDAALVIASFPDRFTEKQVHAALQSMKKHHADTIDLDAYFASPAGIAATQRAAQAA